MEISNHSDDATQQEVSRPFHLGLWLAIGVACAVGGMFPWLITGMRLPLQNLWATQSLPDEMPYVLLPFNQYKIFLLASIMILGSTTAGLLARGLHDRIGRWGLPALVAGILIVQVGAVVQTTLVVSRGLQERPEATFYLSMLVIGSVLAIALGLTIFWLLVKASTAGVVVAAALAAVFTTPWLAALLAPMGFPTNPVIDQLLGYVRFVPAVLIGMAIAWGGVRTVGRVFAAITALGLLWLGPAFMAGLNTVAGTRALARFPAELLDLGKNSFILAATRPVLVVPPLLLAVLVATVGIIAQRLVSKSAPTVNP